MKDLFFLVLGLVVIAGSIFFFLKQPYHGNYTKIIKINTTSIQVEIADREVTRMKGLSNREELLQLSGMLFIFEKPDIYSFWMKEMLFPIDIVWIDSNFTVVDIDKDVSPNTYPQVYRPSQPAQYVLELPAGFTTKYRIDIGAVVQY